MIKIPSASFNREVDGKVQTVSLSSFYISDTNITVREWTDYLRKSGKSKAKISFWRGKLISSLNNDVAIEINENWPAYYISFHEVVEFCNWQSIKDGLEPVYEISNDHSVQIKIRDKANGYRVMTKAEWEYLSGIYTEEWSKEKLLKYGCFWDNNRLSSETFISPVPVKSFQKDAFGLYDIVGTINEFLWDFYNEETWSQFIENPKGEVTYIPDEN